MSAPLDPARLTPVASLNRVRIVDLPGVALEADVAGKTAYELLSADALAAEVAAHGAALGLEAADRADRERMLRRFGGGLLADDARVRAAAEAVAARFGRRLSALLLTLQRGDAVNRQARDDWDVSYWAYWAGVEAIWLGGGLMSAPIGRAVRQHAAAFLAAAGQTHPTLHLAAQPAVLPLIGAARSVPSGYPAAVVCDFGGTAVKRAIAEYQDDRLAALRLLPSVRSPAAALPGAPTQEAITALAYEMAALLAASWDAARAGGMAPAPVLVASVASYMRDNQPLPRQGGAYAQLHSLSANLGDWLAARVSDILGQAVAVELLHDGTAAARTVAGMPRSAVIMLGTALGVGFPPPDAGLRPVAPEFAVRAA